MDSRRPEDRECRRRCKSGVMGRKRSSGVHNTTQTHIPCPQLRKLLDQCVCAHSMWLLKHMKLKEESVGGVFLCKKDKVYFMGWQINES